MGLYAVLLPRRRCLAIAFRGAGSLSGASCFSAWRRLPPGWREAATSWWHCDVFWAFRKRCSCRPHWRYIASYDFDSTRLLPIHRFERPNGGRWLGYLVWRLHDGTLFVAQILFARRSRMLVAVIWTLVLRPDASVTTARATELASEPPGQKILAIIKTPTAVSLIFLAFALSLTSWPTHSWLPTNFFENFKLSLTRAGSIVTLFAALPALLGGIAGGVLADRWSRHDVRGRMAVQVIGFSIMAPTMLAIGFMPSATTVAASCSVDLLHEACWKEIRCRCFAGSCHRIAGRWPARTLTTPPERSRHPLSYPRRPARGVTWGIGYTLSAMSALLFVALGVTAMVMVCYLAINIQRQREVDNATPQALHPE